MKITLKNNEDRQLLDRAVISDRFFNDTIHQDCPEMTIRSRAVDFKIRNPHIEWSVRKLVRDFSKRV